MDAPELKRESKQEQKQESRQEPKPACSPTRRRYVRLAIVWLAAVLAWGLWQAYGAWLFIAGPGHDF
jgi:hypothetical protein